MPFRDVEETGHGEGLNVGHEGGGEVSRMVAGFLARMLDGGGWGVIHSSSAAVGAK